MFGDGWVKLVWAVRVSIKFFFYSTTFQGGVLLAGARLTGEGCHVTVCPGEGGGVKLKEKVCQAVRSSAHPEKKKV